MCLVENGGKEAQQVAEVICIPKTIPEHTGHQIRSIRVCAYCRVSTDDDGQYPSFFALLQHPLEVLPPPSAGSAYALVRINSAEFPVRIFLD